MKNISLQSRRCECIFRRSNSSTDLVLIVKTLDNFIQWINPYPADEMLTPQTLMKIKNT